MAKEMASVTVSAEWSSDQPTPQWANQFVVQSRPEVGEVVLTFGIVAPVLAGTGKEQLAQVEKLQERGLQVTPVTRVMLTRQIAEQFCEVLGSQLGIAAK
jgi:hypothetical protein